MHPVSLGFPVAKGNLSLEPRSNWTNIAGFNPIDMEPQASGALLVITYMLEIAGRGMNV